VTAERSNSSANERLNPIEVADATDPLRKNNFDLVRLVAACQVAVYHGLSHLGVLPADHFVVRFLDCLPGVPVFFFVSGFLVSLSFERSPTVADYARNRFLRLFPALVVCVLLSACIPLVAGYLGTAQFSWLELLAWIAAQLTVFQFYNPEFMRGFGVGVLNGSLWTISVEIQFYLIVPLMYGATSLIRPVRAASLALGFAIVLMAAVNQAYVISQPVFADSAIYKLFGVSFLPWVYMFLCGMLAQRLFPAVYRLTSDRFLLWAGAYGICALAAFSWRGSGFGNAISPWLFVPLAAATLSAAFSNRTLCDRLLSRNDVSYGVYIWHMPIINLLVYTGWGGTWRGFSLAMVGTLLAAALSWIFIERPALRLKRRSLYQH
jgi:peptidoglycan/LPS O-acetylase OafA/YrhL